MGIRDNGYFNTIHRNALEFKYYYTWIKNIAMSSFAYSLPKSINVRFMEQTLADKGSCVIFFDRSLDKNGQWLCLPFVGRDGYNVYGDVVPDYAYGYNNYKFKVDPSQCVVVYNDMQKMGEIDTLEFFAEKLYRKSRIIDVNVNAQKTPLIIRCDQRSKHSVIQLYNDYDGDRPYVFGDKNLNLSDIFDVIKTDAPFVADKINALKTSDINEVLNHYGVSTNADKKERLVSSEVDQGNATCNANVYSRLYMRQLAMRELSKLTGQNCRVAFRARTLDQEGVIQQVEQLHDKYEGDL